MLKGEGNCFLNCRQKWRNTFCLKENYPEKPEKGIFQTNIKITQKAVFKKSMQFHWGKYGLFSDNTVL